MCALCAAGLPNIDFAFAHQIADLLPRRHFCDNANSVINSAEYNGCHSADKEPRRDHVFRRQAKITALLMSTEGTKCFHKQATAIVFRLGWEEVRKGCGRFHVFATRTERDRPALRTVSGGGDLVKLSSTQIELWALSMSRLHL